MKRKVKRYDEGGGVEEMKKGLFAAKEDKEQEDSRSTYFKSPSSTRSGLPSAKESSGTSYNAEYKEEAKAKPAKKKAETSQKFPLKGPEYEDTKAKIGNQSFPVEGPKYRGTVKSKDMGSQKFPVEGPKYRGTVSAKELGSQTFSKGGSTASKRADGCAMRGKTRGKIY
jgi:hypothetical protein